MRAEPPLFLPSLLPRCLCQALQCRLLHALQQGVQHDKLLLLLLLSSPPPPQVCALCCLRMRLCYRDNKCPLCKTEAKQVSRRETGGPKPFIQTLNPKP